MATISESIGREALLAFASQYSSMSEALMELIDNPFDYRRGRRLTVEVTIDKRNGLIRVLDHGGEGMNAGGLAEWIGWGTGHEHATTDIGQYHVGGKLAAIYLAEGLEIICRRAGEHDIWRFDDPRWGSRTDLFHGEPDALAPDRLPGALSGLAAQDSVGFTCVTLRGLKRHRYEQRILGARLANAYRSLIVEGHCSIILDGDRVEPLDIPVSASFAPTEIPSTKLDSGVRVRGRIWVTDRDRLPSGRGVSFKAGVRTVFNGRTITEGEEFGHYLAGRGTLQRLVGEIQVTGVRPNTTKTGWHQDSPEWQAVEQFMYEQMSPLVAELNNLGDARPISREQRSGRRVCVDASPPSSSNSASGRPHWAGYLKERRKHRAAGSRLSRRTGHATSNKTARTPNPGTGRSRRTTPWAGCSAAMEATCPPSSSISLAARAGANGATRSKAARSCSTPTTPSTNASARPRNISSNRRSCTC